MDELLEMSEELGWSLVEGAPAEHDEDQGRALYESQFPRTYVRYVSDPNIQVHWFEIEGERREALVREIVRSTGVWPAEALRQVDFTSEPAQLAHALYRLAAAGPREPEDDIVATFQRALRHEVADLRMSALLAVAYVGWRRLEPLVREVAENDPNAEVRAYAKHIAVGFAPFGTG